MEIPVARGAAGPLSLISVHAKSAHGANGRKGIALPVRDAVPLPSARSLLAHNLRERRVECIIVLGPLTNLAQLISEEPKLFEEVESVWMGGTLSEGNVTPLAEFNAYADPEAAARVLRSGLRTRVIGLDVTRHVRLRAQDLSDSPLGESPTGRVLDQALRALMELEHPLQGEPCALLHDPCAVVAAIFPNCFRYERKALETCVEEGRERGRLLEHAAAGSPAVDYAVEVRGPDVSRLFLDRLAAWSGKVDTD